MKKEKILFQLIFLLVVLGVNAQYKTNIDSGRPGNSIGVFTVGKDVFQIESGIDYSNSEDSYQTNLVLRFGIAERIEVNAGLGTNNESNEIGFYSFGAKFNIFEGDSMLPSSGFQTTFNISNDEVQNSYSSMLFLLGYNFNEKWSYTLNFGANVDLEKRAVIENGESKNIVFVEGVYTFNLSYQINDRWAVFVEPFGTVDKYYSPKIKINLNAGLSYLINKDLKIDLLGGSDINIENLKGVNFGAGVSWRLAPKR